MLEDSVKRRARPSRKKVTRVRKPSGETDRGRKALLALGAILIPALIGYLLAVFLLFPAPDVAAQGIAVPSVVGKTVEDARAEVLAAGLGTLEITRLPHPDAAEDIITAQSPLAGQQLRDGASVRVAVSSGVPRVTVPNLADFPADRAAALLTRLGFRVQRNEEESEAEVGRVIRQDPAPGTVVAVPARVVIWVSSGPAPVEQPDTGGIATLSRNFRSERRLGVWTRPSARSTLERVTLDRYTVEGQRP
jgi:serine/threonine-protein kinase